MVLEMMTEFWAGFAEFASLASIRDASLRPSLPVGYWYETHTSID